MSCRHFSALLVLAAACGGEAPRPPAEDAAPGAAPVPAAQSRDACAILPAAQVAAIVGQQVRDSLALSMTGPGGAVTLSQCNYATEANPAVASLMVRRGQEGQAAAAASQGPRQTLVESGIPVEDVPGLGDLAFWGGNQLHVFTDSGWYLIVTPEASGGLTQARALAEKALAGL